jgi:hypothetical protein
MPANVQSAEAYFAPTNHIRSAHWKKFEAEQKAAAIAQAKRILNRACRSEDIETDFETDEDSNPEYAIYEQALYMLQNLPMANADETFAVADAVDYESDTKTRRQDQGIIAPEARRWLTAGDDVAVSRG